MNEQPFNPNEWIAATHFDRRRPLLPELVARTYAELNTDEQYAVYTSLSGDVAAETFDFFTDNLIVAD